MNDEQKLPDFVAKALENYSHMKSLASGPIGRYGNANLVQANVDDARLALVTAILRYGEKGK